MMTMRTKGMNNPNDYPMRKGIEMISEVLLKEFNLLAQVPSCFDEIVSLSFHRVEKEADSVKSLLIL